jgi:hypothetical protein
MPISYLMDRRTVNISKAQVGFMDIIIIPSYETLVELMPNIQPMLDQGLVSKERWSCLIDKYDEKLEMETKNGTPSSLGIMLPDDDDLIDEDSTNEVTNTKLLRTGSLSY